MMRSLRQSTFGFLISLLTVCLVQPLALAQGAAQSGIIRYDTLHHPEISTSGMVSSQNVIASQVGADILARGGNAVDAAVAVGFALAVTLPRAGNLGGGGFMLVHLAETGETIAIDYRERAPGQATRDMFLGDDGNVDNKRARFSHLSAGVPGTVSGLHHALENYGTMSWRDVIKPAIALAEDGIAVSYDLAENLKMRSERLQTNEATAKAFFKTDGELYVPNDQLVQRDLAWSLRQLAKHGPDAFYKGAIADKIVAEMQAGGGLITKADLAAYEPAIRKPVRGTYRGYEIVSMPPPSSGGVHVIQMLNILENFDLKAMGHGSAAKIHVLTEAMKMAYADRSQHLGDPDHYAVPVAWLTGKGYGKELAGRIQPMRAMSSDEIAPGVAPRHESEDTTHFSIMDAQGNAVANTYTLNFSYGSGIMVRGAGFLLNNEMDDFSAKPGTPNGFGLLGGKANAIAPQKRPLSSMTPTMVFRDGKPWLVTGSPGGSRIITAVLQVLVNVMDHEMNIADAMHQPRLHHQWFPDQLQIEPGVSADTLRLLEGMGHKIVVGRSMGSVQSVMFDSGYYLGSSDSRRPGAGTVGVDESQLAPGARKGWRRLLRGFR